MRSNIARGVRYQSKNIIPIPCVRKAVDRGTLSRIWGKIEPEIKIKLAGKPAERRFPRPTTSPYINAVTGANNGPTEAMPSVANDDAL